MLNLKINHIANIMKQTLITFLRKIKLLTFAEKIRSAYIYHHQKSQINQFKSNNPLVIIPPWDIAYDAYGGFDPSLYEELGQSHAKKITRFISKYAGNTTQLKIADWGCGPMRVLRLLPNLLGDKNTYIGLDYNRKTIDWAKEKYPKIQFLKNELAPPLPLADESVDILYCISVFTHLSEEVTNQYIADIHRVLKKGGLLIATLHGDKNSENLTPSELEQYKKGDFVVRGNVEEGKRIYVSYHPEQFVKSAFSQFSTIERDITNDYSYFNQEWWVFKKGGFKFEVQF